MKARVRHRAALARKWCPVRVFRFMLDRSCDKHEIFFVHFLQRCSTCVEDVQKWTCDWSQLCICFNCTVMCSQQCACTNNMLVRLVRLMLVMLNDHAHNSRIARLKVGTHCNVTAYRNAVSWQCKRDSWPRNVSKVGDAETLRACSVCCGYLAVTSKGWYGYGLSRSERHHRPLLCPSVHSWCFSLEEWCESVVLWGFLNVLVIVKWSELRKVSQNLSNFIKEKK